MKKSNIIHVAAYYPPHLGGLERVTEEVSAQLARDGYVVTILTSNLGGKNLPQVEHHPNLLIKRLSSFEFAHSAIIPSLLWYLLRAPKQTIFHLHLGQVYVPEMVWLASKLRGIPYVVHYHLDVEPSGKLGFLFVWWKRWIQPVIIRGSSHVITLSPEQSTLVEGRYGKSSTQVTFISNGVGNTFLEIGRHTREFRTPLRLLFVGRLSVQKRPERLIEALNLVKASVTLTIVGEGEDRAKHEALVLKLGLKNVLFRGALYNQDLLEAYRSSDVFVLPSDREGMPLVLLEAMAAGLPVIGSDVLGIHELIKDVGILVSDPSAATFAVAIETLVQDQALLIALSQKSFQEANRYSWSSLVKKLEEVYEALTI